MTKNCKRWLLWCKIISKYFNNVDGVHTCIAVMVKIDFWLSHKLNTIHNNPHRKYNITNAVKSGNALFYYQSATIIICSILNTRKIGCASISMYQSNYQWGSQCKNELYDLDCLRIWTPKGIDVFIFGRFGRNVARWCFFGSVDGLIYFFINKKFHSWPGFQKHTFFTSEVFKLYQCFVFSYFPQRKYRGYIHMDNCYVNIVNRCNTTTYIAVI